MKRREVGKTRRREKLRHRHDVSPRKVSYHIYMYQYSNKTQAN